MSEKHLSGIGGGFDRIVFDGDGTAWVREKTCHAEFFDNLKETDGNGDAWAVCSECGWLLCVLTEHDQKWPNYCPGCGAKVVE